MEKSRSTGTGIKAKIDGNILIETFTFYLTFFDTAVL